MSCVLGFSFATAQTCIGDPMPSSDYATLTTAGLTDLAEQLSTALSKAGFIPTESFTNPSDVLLGKSTQPFGNIGFNVCEYRFFYGAIEEVTRRDLFQDRGPDSLILRHLTNEVLKLNVANAPARALAVLQCVGLDSKAIKKAYKISVRDDLMDAHPIRDAGPNFPQDLHFFGELISRKKIRIIVDLQPANPKLLAGSRFDGHMSVEFLATTGELLKIRFTSPDVLTLLGVSGPTRLTISGASDFTPVFYFSASNKLARITNSSESGPAALLDATWRDLEQKLGSRKPVCYLVADNLNAPQPVARGMNKLVRGIPWAGVSRVWNSDLPFERSRMKRLAQDGQGIELLAICGDVEVQLNRISNQTLDDLMSRLKFPAGATDHAVFLFQPGDNRPSNEFIDQLKARLSGKAKVFGDAREQPMATFGFGYCYFDGQVCTNTSIAMTLSGFLPLQMDTLSLMRHTPEQHIVGWEVYGPLEQFGRSFEPNPLQKLVDRLGMDTVRLLQQADRVEVFRLTGRASEKPPSTNGQNINKWAFKQTGKTQGRESARELANAILNETNSFAGPGANIKGCLWDPAIAFRTWHAKESVTIVVCFDCNSLLIEYGDAEGKAHGRVSMDFDMNRETFARLAQLAFPSDEAFKHLQED
jgi:hypothetical protein